MGLVPEDVALEITNPETPATPATINVPVAICFVGQPYVAVLIFMLAPLPEHVDRLFDFILEGLLLSNCDIKSDLCFFEFVHGAGLSVGLLGPTQSVMVTFSLSAQQGILCDIVLKVPGRRGGRQPSLRSGDTGGVQGSGEGGGADGLST